MKIRFDNRYVAPLFITCILLVGHLFYGILESYERTAIAIVSAIVAELVLGRIFFGKWLNLASGYITGISVGILLRSPAFWPYALCSVISIMSKYVLRVKDRHLWNPSNFGICALLLLAPDTVAVLSIQWGNFIWPMLVIWILGSIIIWRAKRFHISFTTWCRSFCLRFCAVGSRAIRGGPRLRRLPGRCTNCLCFSWLRIRRQPLDPTYGNASSFSLWLLSRCFYG